METFHVLADIHDLSPIFTPLRTTQRIKYTCFNVSQNYLVFGASSGGLYVFRREPCLFLQLLPHQEGAIVHVAISPDEKLFAFASVKGVVCVLEKNSSGLGARRIFTSSEHVGVNITALHWNSVSNELFIGDQVGKVSVISLFPFMMKNMFNPPSCTLMVLDSQIVQMDWQADLLLVSTLTRSYICDMTKECFRQIGVKPRDGEYGSCFYVCGDLPIKTQCRTEAVGGRFTLVSEGEKTDGSEESQCVKVFCARPGSRLWEVKIDGTVLNTHQFKQALAIPPTGIIKVPQSTESSQERDNEPSKSTNNQDDDVIWNNQSFNFCKLFILAKKYLFTFKKDGIYVFDPEKASVVMWSNNVVDIIDAQVLKDTIYLRTSSGQMFGILFTPLEKFLIRLYLRKQYALCAELCEMHCQYLMKEVPSSSKLYLLADLGTKLSNDEVTERIFPLLQEISKCAQETRSAQRLESGIFVVENLHFLSKEESEMSIPDLPQVRRNERLKDKSRSLSVSPDRSRRKKKVDILIGNTGTHRSDSSSSLPELGKSQYKNSSRGGNGSSDGGSSSSNNDKIVDSKKKSEDVENRGSSSMKKSFSKELFTSFDTSPETIQALKEIGQSVSSKITSGTKTLKEKWQVLEGKILGNEATPELLDIRTADYVAKLESHGSVNTNEEIVFSDNSKVEKSGKRHSQPEVDISKVILVLQQLDNLRENEDEKKLLICKLCFEILLLYNNYIAIMQGSLNKISRTGNFEGEDHDSKVIMKYFLVEWPDKSFPFEEYFSSEVLKDLSERFHCSLKTKVLVGWLEELSPILESDVCLESLLLIYSQEAVRLDVLLSRFLVVCSELLDPHCILQCIKESGITCYYMSFSIVLDKYQAGALQQVGKERSVESSCWQWPLPLRLNAMFFMLQMNQIETCYMMGNNIDLQDIWYLTLRLQQQQQGQEYNFDCSHSYSMFLTYLDRATDTGLVMQSLLKNDYLTSITAMAFENVNQGLGGSCKCGFPFPVGKATQVLFSDIGRSLSNHLWLTNHDRHQQLCEHVPVLWKQMLRNTPPDNLKSVLPLLVQLGDFSILEPLLPCMTLDLWKQVLDMTATVRSGQCLKCGLQSLPRNVGDSVCLSDVGALLVKHVGAFSALDILSKHSASVGQGSLDERFYKSCIFSTIVDSHCEDLRADAVDLALTSCDSPTRMPLVSNELGKLLEEALALDFAKVTVPIGEPDCLHHHWGVQMNLQADPCPCCTLPLGSPGLLQDTGLMVFQCGHAFHAVCLCKRSVQTVQCLICNQGT
ncbi:Hermansky-Pudlak syndrome 5 protein homolog [Gryllus bimaculatus]|nr:Hermansky-Pudlak syndrome 5 protein homolog [Gryllus bimaculatus]